MQVDGLRTACVVPRVQSDLSVEVPLLFIIFIAGTFLELFVLGEVSGALGTPATIGLCIGTAFVGARLTRQQGLNTLRRLSQRVQHGELPARELLDGLLILAAGLFLITPGLVSDGIGLLLLWPTTRAVARQWALGFFQSQIERGRVDVRQASYTRHSGSGYSRGQEGKVEIIPPSHAPRPPKPPQVVVITPEDD